MSCAHDSSPSLGLSRISVQQAINEGAERRLRVATIRIVEVKAGTRQRPVSEDALESSARGRLVDAVVVVGIKNAQALQCRFDDDILVVRDQRPFHSHVELLTLLLELPAVNLAAAGKAPVDAGMLVKIGGGLWLATTGKIVGGGEREEFYVWREAHGKHGFLAT